MEGSPVRKAMGKLHPPNILSHEVSGILNKEEEKKAQACWWIFSPWKLPLWRGCAAGGGTAELALPAKRRGTSLCIREVPQAGGGGKPQGWWTSLHRSPAGLAVRRMWDLILILLQWPFGKIYPNSSFLSLLISAIRIVKVSAQSC